MQIFEMQPSELIPYENNPLDKKMKKRVELLRVPYPKRDDKK